VAGADHWHEGDEVADGVLWRALAALSEDDRELLLMRGWDELDVAEIAAVLTVPPAVVSSRLYKARQRLGKVRWSPTKDAQRCARRGQTT
jgi:RNA polymerase sigma factor (sigma-70 family)